MKTQTGRFDPRKQRRGFDWDKYEQETGRSRIGERLGQRAPENHGGDISGVNGHLSERSLGGVVLDNNRIGAKMGEVPSNIRDQQLEPRQLEEVGKS